MSGFTKEERLSGKKNFELLVTKGNSFFLHPFRLTWMYTHSDQKNAARIAFGVPKRNFKSAVKRNRIKRLMREAYRQHKQELYSALDTKSVKIAVMIVYTPKNEPSYAGTQGKIILSLRRLIQAIDGAGKHE